MTEAFHVYPLPRDRWGVRRSGGRRALRAFATETEAIDLARALALKDHAVLYLHRRDGTVRMRQPKPAFGLGG
jgi:Uncharacterized protein conserved in bacteria (DUF2188)